MSAPAPGGLRLDYLREARAVLDDYIEGGEFANPEMRRAVMDSIAFSLASIATSLARLVEEESR